MNLSSPVSFEVLEGVNFDVEFDGTFSLVEENLTFSNHLDWNESERNKHSSSSNDEDAPDSKKRKGGLDCDKTPGRNALVARANRERKKAYVSQLEHTIKSLEDTIASLRAENGKLRKEACEAEENANYLKQCIRHETSLGKFLSAICTSTASAQDNSTGAVVPLTVHVHLNAS